MKNPALHNSCTSFQVPSFGFVRKSSSELFIYPIRERKISLEGSW